MNPISLLYLAIRYNNHDDVVPYSLVDVVLTLDGSANTNVLN